ncbi:hypothetical protein AOLI_G00274960, partial [Acnodon oligacanthus]
MILMIKERRGETKTRGKRRWNGVSGLCFLALVENTHTDQRDFLSLLHVAEIRKFFFFSALHLDQPRCFEMFPLSPEQIKSVCCQSARKTHTHTRCALCPPLLPWNLLVGEHQRLVAVLSPRGRSVCECVEAQC